ncbi:MAG TPA: [protein-PII] uridylyltransferase, partial [Terriglobales bacterium]|nr:[protein-PII] uridylyltransferase [Terriglobales bacterium]
MEAYAPTLIEIPTLAPFLPDQNWGATAKAYLDEGKARLYQAHKNGASGRAVVATYTGLMDDLIRSLFDAASSLYAERFSRLDQRCAIVAQGGYGRGELNPCSDIDLLFLCERTRGAYIENVAERILYTLWDTRLIVGNAMRNVNECVRLAASDLKVKTALLDVRFLCGDETLYREFARAMDEDVLKRGADKFYQDKRAESAQRQERYGDSVYLLEPELKEGEGGLRDLHTAMWMAKVKFKTNKLPELVRKGVLTEGEKDEIEAARDFLWRVRNSLHFLTGQHQDQLRFEYQELIAEEFGYQDTGNAKAVEQLMRAYYLNAATINRFAEEMIDRCVPPARPARLFRWSRSREIRPGVTINAGVLSISGPSLLQDDPVNLIRVFGDAQRHEAVLSGSARRILRAHVDLLDDERRRDVRLINAFFDILRDRHRIYETLLDMHRVGILGAFLPEFGHLLCMVVRDLSHIYTVDQHSLRGVLELERLRAGTYKSFAPLLTQVMRELDRVEIVYLALLLHDIGKGFGARHSERGAAKIPEIAQRLSLNVDDAAQLEFLVAQHLTMSHLAQRRDIHDPRLIVEFAKQVDNADNLKKLYVLTFADMRAVAPKVWNNWHDMLLGELYLQTLDVFEREAFHVESHSARLCRVKERIAAAAKPLVPAPALQSFLADMPDRYFLGTDEESIVHHLQLLPGLQDRPFV